MAVSDQGRVRTEEVADKVFTALEALGQDGDSDELGEFAAERTEDGIVIRLSNGQEFTISVRQRRIAEAD